MTARCRFLRDGSIAFMLIVTTNPFDAAAATVKEEPKGVTVQTARFVAFFDRRSGGMLQTLKAASGQELIRSATVYTDHQMRRPRHHYGSRHEPEAALRVERSAGCVRIVAEGRLLDKSGAEPDGMPFGYRVEYTFDDSPRVRVAAKVTVGFGEPELRGFLAYIFSIPSEREFFANTVDGRICELAAAVSQRTWQSAREPLSAQAPWLGVVQRGGRVLKFTITRQSDPLQNVFFHDSGKGPTTLFFAWLDGGSTRPAHKGEAWELEYVVETMPLAEFGD